MPKKKEKSPLDCLVNSNNLFNFYAEFKGKKEKRGKRAFPTTRELQVTHLSCNVDL